MCPVQNATVGQFGFKENSAAPASGAGNLQRPGGKWMRTRVRIGDRRRSTVIALLFRPFAAFRPRESDRLWGRNKADHSVEPGEQGQETLHNGWLPDWVAAAHDAELEMPRPSPAQLTLRGESLRSRACTRERCGGQTSVSARQEAAFVEKRKKSTVRRDSWRHLDPSRRR